LQVLFGVIDAVGKNVNQDVHRKMVMAMHTTGSDFAWEDRYAMFKNLLDSATLNPKIYMHANRKAFMEPLLKRSELVMADYEEWVVSGGASIVMSVPIAD
jgi:type I restriction enzyme R subunit